MSKRLSALMWRPATTRQRVSGVETMSPTGPHSQLQNIAAMTTDSGDSPVVWPYSCGSMSCPATNSTPTNKPKVTTGERPSRIDGRGEHRGEQRGDPYADVWDESQHGAERRPEHRVRQTDDGQADPERAADAEIHRKLRYEEPRQPLAGIVERERRRSQIRPAGDADEPVAHRFALEQDEDENHQHDARGFERHPYRGQHLLR